MRSAGLLFFFCFACTSAVATPLTLKNYLSLYLSQDESFQRSVNQIEIGEQDVRISNDLFDAQFDLRAQRNQRDTSFPKFSSRDFSESRNSLTGRYTQNTSWGVQASFEGTHYSGASNPSLGAIDEEYELQVSKSLWQNPFGSLDRARVRRFSALKDSTVMENRFQLSNSCSAGIDLFLQAKASQESLDLVLEMEKTSEQALGYATSAYRNKLMREMDYLTAKSEKIQAQEQSVNAKIARDQAMMNLINFSKEQGIGQVSWEEVELPELQEENVFFEQLKLDQQAQDLTNYQLLSSESLLQSTQAQLELVQLEQRSDVQLGVSLGSRTGDVNIGAVVTDYKDESLMVFVDMQWPVGKKSRNALIEKAQLEHRQARLQLNQQKRELSQNYQTLQLNQKKLSEQIALANQKIEIYQRQLNQAIRLIETGRIEMEDFQRYYHRLLQERLQLIEYQRQKHSEQVMLAGLGDKLYLLCKELL